MPKQKIENPDQLFVELEEHFLDLESEELIDPAGKPSFFSVADLMGWVMGFFVIFIIYTFTSWLFDTFFYYKEKATNILSVERILSEAIKLPKDEISILNQEELQRIEERLIDASIRYKDKIEEIKANELEEFEEFEEIEDVEDLEDTDLPEEELRVKSPKKNRSLRGFLGGTLGKEISKNRDEVLDSRKKTKRTKKSSKSLRREKEEQLLLRGEGIRF